MIQRFFKDKTNVVLLVIILTALFLRIFQLGSTPFGLHNDEVANTYGTRYIFQNGHDIYGNKWPVLYLDKFGDYPPIIPMYLSGLGAVLFGNNEFGSRILIAIVGALLVLPAYFLALHIFRSRRTALFTALAVAISPWSIILSRLNAEGIVALTVFATGLLILLKSMSENSIRSLLLGSAILLSTYFIYPSYRIIMPLAFLPLIFFARWQGASRKYLSVIMAMTIITILLTVGISSTHWGKGRFNQTGLASPVSGVAIKIQNLIFDEKSIVVARLLHNKPIGYAKEFNYQYFRYFDPNFLFGDQGIPKIYSAPYSTLLYMSFILLIVAAAIGFIQRKNKNTNYPAFSYLLYLLFIVPVPAAMTVLDVPSIHRALPIFLIVTLLAAYGFNGLKDIKYRGFRLSAIFFLFLTLEFAFFIHNYFVHVSYYTSPYRNDGNTQVAKYIIDNKNKYDAIYVTNNELWLPSYYLFFSSDYNPAYTGKFKENFRMENIGKVHFIDFRCPTDYIWDETQKAGKLAVPKKTLIINAIECPIKEDMFKKTDVIKRVNTTTAFEVVTVNPSYPEK